MNNWVKVAGLLTILVSLLIPHSSVMAENSLALDVPIRMLTNDKGLDLTGFASNRVFEIPLPENWKISDGSWIEIKAGASKLLDAENSKFTILLNGFEVETLNVLDIENASQHIILPTRFFKRGLNKLTISAMLYLPDDLITNCKDWDDPARWLTIEPESNLHLNFLEQDISADLSEFPRNFINPLKHFKANNTPETLLVIPDIIQPDDLQALAAISYAMGHDTEEGFQWKPQILSESQFRLLNDKRKDIVFIDNIPMELQQDLESNINAVALFPSPWSSKNIAMIISDQSRNDGSSPALIFEDTNRKANLHGNIIYYDQAGSYTPPPFQK